jgi:hypothetical protein
VNLKSLAAQCEDKTGMTETVATKKDYYLVTAAAIGIGLLVSFLKAYNDTVINDDAVLYLSMADAMVAGDWEHAFGLFHKPLYPLLIAGASIVTGLTTESAAHVVNALLSSGLIFAFLYTFYNLGASNRLLIITAILVVLFPSLVKYKSMIIRDHGFLAFLIFSIGNIFLYGKFKQLKYLAIAATSLIIANLFRFEGITYIAALPLIAYLAQLKDKPSKRAVLVLSGLLVMGGLLSLYLWQGVASDSSAVSRLTIIFNAKYELFMSKVNIVSDQILTKFNRDSAAIFVLTGFLSVLVVNIIERISIVYGAIAIYGYAKSPDFINNNIRRSWLLFVLVSVITLIGLTFVYHIVIGRYTVALATMFIFPAAYGLHHLLYNDSGISKRTKITIVVIIGLFLLVNTAQKLSGNDNKRYIKDAALWIAENIKEEKILASNNAMLLYYSGHGNLEKNSTGIVAGAGALFPWKNISKADYIAVVRKSSNTSHKDEPEHIRSGKPIKQFSGKRGTVSIYKLKD